MEIFKHHQESPITVILSTFDGVIFLVQTIHHEYAVLFTYKHVQRSSNGGYLLRIGIDLIYSLMKHL